MSKYAKGANLERNRKKELEAAGFFVIRSAGSRGPVDLIGLKRDAYFEPWIILVQCKTSGRITKEKCVKLWELSENVSARPFIATDEGFFEVSHTGRLEKADWLVKSS